MADPATHATLVAAKQRAESEIEGRRAELLALSHAIHANPELSWKEYEASKLVAEALKEAGFAVELGAYDVETAIEAVYGSGDLTVAICAEYDALPGIGHGCGHNVIASAGVGAALGSPPSPTRPDCGSSCSARRPRSTAAARSRCWRPAPGRTPTSH